MVGYRRFPRIGFAAVSRYGGAVSGPGGSFSEIAQVSKRDPGLFAGGSPVGGHKKRCTSAQDQESVAHSAGGARYSSAHGGFWEGGRCWQKRTDLEQTMQQTMQFRRHSRTGMAQTDFYICMVLTNTTSSVLRMVEAEGRDMHAWFRKQKLVSFVRGEERGMRA